MVAREGLCCKLKNGSKGVVQPSIEQVMAGLLQSEIFINILPHCAKSIACSVVAPASSEQR